MHRHQQGMALFVSLIILLLLTIIGVAGMQNATLQEKMAGNSKFKNESFQYAEAGLREGEALIGSSAAIQGCAEVSGPPGADVSAGITASGSVGCDRWLESDDGNSFYYIEKITTSSAAMGVEAGISVTLFRVTASATVGNSTSTVESIYAFNAGP